MAGAAVAPRIARRKGLSYSTTVKPELVVPPQTEARFQTVLVQLARTLGWKIYHPWISVHSSSGWPDLFCVRGDRAIAAELKNDRGRVTIAQRGWLEDLARVPGIESYLWRPSDWPTIVRVLR